MHDLIDIRKEFPWLGMETIFFVEESAEEKLIEGLSRLGFGIVKIRGHRITNEEEFFLEIAAALRFPGYFGRNWDAFWDCFSDSAHPPANRFAILWQKASICLKSNPYEFVKITHHVLSAITDLRRIDPTKPRSAQVEIFFLGPAPEFPKRIVQ